MTRAHSPCSSLFRASRSITSALLVSAGILLAGAPIVAAYNPSAATAYAERWVWSQNPAYPDLVKTDCTNFVSQALAAGGYPQTSGNQNLYSSWWVSGTSSWSLSWTVAPDLLNQLYVRNPGGAPMAYWSPGSTARADSLGVNGDVLFYDWGGASAEGVSHASIMVDASGYGIDSEYGGWEGDLVNTHSTDHQHVFWSLRPENFTNYLTTWVTVSHVSPNN